MWPVHAVPRGYRKGGRVARGAPMGRGAPRRAIAGDGRRFHLRARAGRAEADPLRAEILPRRGPMKIDAREVGGTVAFTLNGENVMAVGDETIIQAADRLGVRIPRLCYKPGYRPDGNCRACMVEIKGERLLAPSCCRRPTAGMEVTSASGRAVHAQKMIVELLA